MHRLPSHRRVLPHGAEGQVSGGGLEENKAIPQICLILKVSIAWRAGQLSPARLQGGAFWGQVGGLCREAVGSWRSWLDQLLPAFPHMHCAHQSVHLLTVGEAVPAMVCLCRTAAAVKPVNSISLYQYRIHIPKQQGIELRPCPAGARHCVYAVVARLHTVPHTIQFQLHTCVTTSSLLRVMRRRPSSQAGQQAAGGSEGLISGTQVCYDGV